MAQGLLKPIMKFLSLQGFTVKALVVSLFVYLIFSILLFISVDGEISSITSDLHQFNHAVVSRFPTLVSEKAQLLEADSPAVTQLLERNWQPAPFYPIIFLAPFWLFQSEIMLWVLGLFIGFLSILCFAIILNRISLYNKFSTHCVGITLLILPLNFNFIVDSIGVSSMSVAACFVLAAFAFENTCARAILLTGAAMTRPNYLIALIALAITLLLIRPKKSRKIALQFLPSVVVSMIFYKFYFSTYPGGAINYLFYSAYQGLDYTLPSFDALTLKYLGRTVEILDEKLSIQDALKMLSSWDGASHFLNIWTLKISVVLGFIHEKLFISEHQLYIAKIWRTLYFVGVTLPGTFAMPLLVASKNISRSESCMYCWAFLFLLMNSMMQGDPRYLMGTYFIIVLALVRFGFEFFNSNLVASKSLPTHD